MGYEQVYLTWIFPNYNAIICKYLVLGGGRLMDNKTQLGLTLRLISLAVSIYFCFNTEALLRGGYASAIDGLVVARTLMIIFTLYLIIKLGDFFISKKD